MAKIYAVRKGRKTGIFYNWNDCKESVSGYSGAEYKSFTTEEEAKTYLNRQTNNFYDGNFSEKEVCNMIKSKDTIVAFVDGSYDDTKKRYSYGLVALGLGEIYEDKCFDIEPMMLPMRNVAGEILGAQMAMEYCLSNNIHNLKLFYDYEGIAKWALGEWKTEKYGTSEYKKFYDSIKDTLKVEFFKVPAHTGVYYNERVDELAKEALGLV